MEIKWTNCAEELPRNDMNDVIINDGINNYIFPAYMLHISWMFNTIVRLQHKWTYYSDEKWRELHEQNSQKE